ncbi:MAG: hypothetical protein HY301_14400 [Verrucomicrobia bacterium]|nr:hypothetical protein [Verrucomicrobiota bacterium]
MTTPPGLLRIHPQLEYNAPTPDGKGKIRATEWCMPGLWNFAKCAPADGGNAFFTELPFSMGVQAPSSIDAVTGKVSGPPSQHWFLDNLAAAWRERLTKPVEITVVKRRPVKRAVLINCLYPWWGDAVNILWRVNQLRASKLAEHGLGIVMLITPAMQWLLPPDVDEAWVVPDGVSFSRKWNDGLDAAIHAKVAQLEECFMPVLFQPTRMSPEEVLANTGITPFPREQWLERLKEKPVVTLMYRPDRCWSPGTSLWHKLERLLPRGRMGRLRLKLSKQQIEADANTQYGQVIELANILRQRLPKIEFAVCGTGTKLPLPSWMKDMRVDKPDAKSNRASCEQCARSHVFVSVHGSHMTLPSAFPGATINLVPPMMWWDPAHCWFLTTDDICEAMFCNRWLPTNTTPRQLADIVTIQLLNFPINRFAYHHRYAHPLTEAELEQVRAMNNARHEFANTLDAEEISYLLAP